MNSKHVRMICLTFVVAALAAAAPVAALAETPAQQVGPIAEEHAPVEKYADFKFGQAQLRFEKSEPALKLIRNKPHLLPRIGNNPWVCSVTWTGAYGEELVLPKDLGFVRFHHIDKEEGAKRVVKRFAQKLRAARLVVVPGSKGEEGYYPELTLSCNNGGNGTPAIDAMTGFLDSLQRAGGVLRSFQKKDALKGQAPAGAAPVAKPAG